MDIRELFFTHEYSMSKIGELRKAYNHLLEQAFRLHWQQSTVCRKQSPLCETLTGDWAFMVEVWNHLLDYIFSSIHARVDNMSLRDWMLLVQLKQDLYQQARFWKHQLNVNPMVDHEEFNRQFKTLRTKCCKKMSRVH
jgi:hypothetical protein